MKINKIQFKNFMGYNNLILPKDNQEFPGGLILISGRNSSGKSTILEGILFAFFGPSVFSGRNAESFISYGQDKSEIHVYFILDNSQFYIFRKWSRTTSTSVKLFEMDKNNKNYKEVKSFDINDFFEISRDQALNTVFVRQGEVEELANKKGAQLRDMLIDLFRLNIIDDSLKYLDDNFKTKKNDKSRLEKSRVPIERIKLDIEKTNTEITNDKEFLVEKMKNKKGLEEKLLRYPPKNLIKDLENQFRLKEIAEEKYKSYKTNFQAKIKKSGLKIKDFSSSEKIKEMLNLKLKSKSHLESILEELDKKKQATVRGKGTTKGKMDDITNKIKKMQKSISFSKETEKIETVRCPTCQSELTREHYNRVMDEFNQELEICKNKLIDITNLIEKTEVEIKSHNEELDLIKRDIALIEGLNDDYQNYHAYEKDVMQASHNIETFFRKNKNLFKDTNPESIKELTLKIDNSLNELRILEREITQKNERIEFNNVKIKELNAETLRMKNLEKEISEIEIDLEHITKAKEFVRRFVTEYMVVKRLVKNIALKTDRYIKDFTSGQYSDLLLDLYGTKKTGLSLKIKDHFNGQYESIDVLSGGDRTALGMALRLAISELMSIIRPTKESPKKNPKIDFLLLDEPLAALDETRRERILKFLIKSKTFSQIFLITHTTIPQDIQTHKIMVDKDHSNGFSHAKFEKSPII